MLIGDDNSTGRVCLSDRDDKRRDAVERDDDVLPGTEVAADSLQRRRCP